ncbi:MAG TPA: ATP-binding cassette domain-containing protein [Gammaproteobacteria bacterium]
MPGDVVVSVENLWRRYGELVAVRDLNFELRRGEVLGFLGPNGAGKSSTMQILAGSLAPSEGRVRIGGVDLLDEPGRAKASLGYLPEQPPVYPELSVREYLRFCARLNGVPRKDAAAAVDRALRRCGLVDVGERLIGNLSKGYQQRVGIAQAIIHEPAVVILDEPTVGLDPIQIREIRELIRELGCDHSVILSTHILPEVQMLCSRVLIIHQGRMVFSDSMQSLNAGMQADSLVVGAGRLPDETRLASLDGVKRVEMLGGGRARLRHDGAPDFASRIAKHAVEEDWALFELTPERKTLEQVFVELTSGESGQEDAA